MSAEKSIKKSGISMEVKQEKGNEENLAQWFKENEAERKVETEPTAESKKDDSFKEESQKDAPKVEIEAEKKLEKTPEKK